MPNWVRNVVTVSENTMNKIKEKYFTDGVLDFNKIVPMPPTLNITESSRNEEAILYALSFKSPKEVNQIIDVLKNTNDILYKNYWRKIQEHFSTKKIFELDDVAKKYKPTEDEKQLGIKTFQDLGDICISNIVNYGCQSWYDWCIENWGTKWDASYFSCNKTTMIFETAWSTPLPIFEKISKEFPEDFIEVKYADECYSNMNNGEIKLRNGIEEYDGELDENFAEKVWNIDIETEENLKENDYDYE